MGTKRPNKRPSIRRVSLAYQACYSVGPFAVGSSATSPIIPRMTNDQRNMVIFVVLALGIPCLLVVIRIIAPLFW